jgi:integrase
MARVQKRIGKDGVSHYIVKWRTADGNDRTKGGFRTRKAAHAYATKVENGKLRGVEFDPKAGGITFREAAVSWLDSRHDLKATTLAGHRYALAPVSDRRGDGKRLGIDTVFGGYPLNAIKREHISDWVQRLVAAGKKPSTVRHAYFLVRMVLAQAVADGRLTSNPADYVRLPPEHGNPGIVDDPAQFLSASQVSALVAATPWPYNVYVHVAAWTGLRAAELAGLQVGDMDLPEWSPKSNTADRPGVLRVTRTARVIGNAIEYLAPKTNGSRRCVPLTAATSELLRDYLAEHPRQSDRTAPLFPGMTLTVPRPTGVRSDHGATTWKAVRLRQATALAELSVAEAEARLVLDWVNPLRHGTFYKAVYRPAVLRATRLTPSARLSAQLKFHSLRHTYASLCFAAGIPPLEISRFMGHAKVTTTLTVYAHLINTDDHAGNMAALGALATGPTCAENVVLLLG